MNTWLNLAIVLLSMSFNLAHSDTLKVDSLLCAKSIDAVMAGIPTFPIVQFQATHENAPDIGIYPDPSTEDLQFKADSIQINFKKLNFHGLSSDGKTTF